MKNLIALSLLVSPAIGSAQAKALDPQPAEIRVTVSARGNDVRQVLTDMFQQAKKSCVIQRNIQASLFLSLNDTPFDKALTIVCQEANLVPDLKEGIYFIHRPIEAAKPMRPVFIPQRLSPAVLSRRVTTRLVKAPIAKVIDAFASETGVKIELDPQVPAYKLDAFLTNTSLGFALDQVTKAAGLIYKFTDHSSIRVGLAEAKVALAR